MDSRGSPVEAIEGVSGVSPSVEGRRRDRRWMFVVLAIAMLSIDQAIKFWCEGHLTPRASTNWPWPGVFELELTYNKGIAFGLFSNSGGLFTPVALAISFGAAWYSWRRPAESAWMHASMALLTAGALGNLYDRVRFGWVRDMFATRFVRFPIFNWADACITVATAILILMWSKEAVSGHSHRRQAPAQAEETTG